MSNENIVKETAKEKIIYCSFCGKSNGEVSALIAGPSVFVCNECTGVCVDILMSETGEEQKKQFIKSIESSVSPVWDQFISAGNAEKIVREIEFPPEYQQAGITILSNFSELIRKKYKNQKVKVSIQQMENTVIMIVEGENGVRERIEEEMNSYNLVLRGEADVSSLSDDPYEIVRIKQQLRIAELQLENQKDLLALEKRHNSQMLDRSLSVEQQYQEMVKMLSVSLGKQVDNQKYLQELIKLSLNTQSFTTKNSLKKLFSVIESGECHEKSSEISRELSVIKNEDPSTFKKLTDFTESCAAGVVGNSLYSWLITLLNSLPK